MTSRSSIDVATIDDAAPKPLPAEHIGSVASTDSRPSTPSTTSRPTSYVGDTGARLKRLSLIQPVNPTPSRHRHAASNVAPRVPIEVLDVDDGTPKESDFLTALASQERKVLELKDALKQAEQELTNLKKNWAHHEAIKRRTDGRRLHQMRPMSVANVKITPKAEDLDGSSAWMYDEMEKRKALMGHARTSSRRVFSGSRHTKQLSLVPTTREENPSSSLIDALDTMIEEVPKHPPMSRSQSASNGTTNGTSGGWARRALSPTRKEFAIPQHEVIQAGTKLANELKDGIWSFFEELKHVAVGEDKSNAGTSQSGREDSVNPSRNSIEASKSWTSLIQPPDESKPRTDAPLIDNAPNFWIENGLDTTQTDLFKTQAQQKTPQKVLLHTRDFDGESWETWDSPDAKQPSPSSEASTYRTSGSFKGSSPATSNEATPRAATATTSTASKRESIQWPALNKYGPAQLRRTASHLMSEWERSLTPPPRNAAPAAGAEASEDLIEVGIMEHLR